MKPARYVHDAFAEENETVKAVGSMGRWRRWWVGIWDEFRVLRYEAWRIYHEHRHWRVGLAFHNSTSIIGGGFTVYLTEEGEVTAVWACSSLKTAIDLARTMERTESNA